jgi:hypothetical protein
MGAQSTGNCARKVSIRSIMEAWRREEWKVRLPSIAIGNVHMAVRWSSRGPTGQSGGFIAVPEGIPEGPKTAASRPAGLEKRPRPPRKLG